MQNFLKIADDQVCVRLEHDPLAVNEILRLDEIFAATSEDGGPAASDVGLGDFMNNSSAAVVGVYFSGLLVGFFLLTRMGAALWQFHTAIRREYCGPPVRIAAQKMFELAFTQLHASKLVTFVPAFNRPAGMFAAHCGLERQGTITKSFLKDGKLHDQIIYGISRG